MKRNIRIFLQFNTSILIIIILFFSIPSHAESKIAVINSSYDRIEDVLKNYRIAYDLIKLKDLQNRETVSRYNSIFLPSGIDRPFYANINLLSRGTKIMSVSLKNKFSNINKNKISENIRHFVENGGSVYFSGYSYKFLQDSFQTFKFFDNFPYMGMPGRIIAMHKNDLQRFSTKDSSPLYITYTGWIAVKSADDSEILSEASYNTPRGEKHGPISMLFKRGMGEVLYTSYYSSVFSDFRRFNIHRIAGRSLFIKLTGIIEKYEQNITGKIADSVIKGESSRTYNFDLSRGENTIYFIGNDNYYQVDIYDSNMSLLMSVDNFKKEKEIQFISDKDMPCIVKVYPSGDKNFGVYALISASGSRWFPYHKRTLTISAIILFFFILLFLIRFFTGKIFMGGKVYSGRPL